MIEIYSVPIGGPAAAGVKLNVPLAPGGFISGPDISPDSRRVVYNADHQIAGVFELFSVSIQGPATDVIKQNGALAAGGVCTGLADKR